MRAHLERRRGGVRDRVIVAQRGRHDGAERAERRARRDRIGRVRRHQQRGPVAAPQRTLEVRRDLHCEQHRAGGEQPVEFGRVVRD